ncbi:MAG: alpha/beta hydrolase [Rhodobacteraceae bacterium]|nr:alpha/beta hydrolase [Paracoccaceae bacterium]
MIESAKRPPSGALLFLEGRAIGEFFSFAASAASLNLVSPRGDGQPVLVLPGLATSDRSTVALRSFLKSIGYPTYGWDMGPNFGPRPGVEMGLIQRMQDIYEEHGRKISLVGWSLGGIYARQLAKMQPDLVRQVISLGSPFQGNPRATNAWRVYEYTSGESADHSDHHMGGKISAPPPVPTTAIYSKTDGICAWQNCIEQDSDIAENIQVRGSHCGLGHHPAVAYAIADRLAQKEGQWKKFDRSGLKRGIFPEADYAK